MNRSYDNLSRSDIPTQGGDQPLGLRRLRKLGLFAALGLATLTAAGGTLGTTASASPLPASPLATSPLAAKVGAAVPASHVITAKLTEFKIALSKTKLSAGTYTFKAVNAGHTVHALEITGPGVAGKRTPGFLQPGKSASFTVTLKAGRYDVFCPVGDHKELGMNLELTVGGAKTTAHVSSTPSSSGGYGY